MTVKDTSSVASHANTVNSAYSKKSSSTSPPNAPEGGVWGVLKYNGEQSRKRNRIGCAFLLLPGLVMMGCPKDSTDAYAVWEKVSRNGIRFKIRISKLVLVLFRSISCQHSIFLFIEKDWIWYLPIRLWRQITRPQEKIQLVTRRSPVNCVKSAYMHVF